MSEEKVLVEVSARHIHLTDADVEALFGPGYKLSLIHILTITAKVEHKGQIFTKDFKFAVLADSPKTRLKRDQIAVNNDFQPLMNENDVLDVYKRQTPAAASG